MTQPLVGFVGLGNMGQRIAGRIVAAGWPVVGYDLAPRADLAGIELVDSPAAVSDRAEVILLSLPDSKAIEAVINGPDGLLGAARSGQVIVDLSTANPTSTVAIHDALAEHGVEFVDAGVSGGAGAAEQGKLVIMAGGSVEQLAKLGPLFTSFSTNAFRMGESGTGHTAKLLNNFLNGVSLSATAEVMVAARKAGLDLDTFLEVLNNGSGINFATLNRFPRIVHGDYLEGGLSGRLMMKDLLLYLERLRELGMPSLNATGSLASFGLAINLGYGDQISNRVVDAIGDISGGVRLQDREEDTA